MKVVVVGGHGRVGLLLTQRLSRAGQEVIGTVRSPRHFADVLSAGGRPALLDIASCDVDTLGDVLMDAQAVVFAAGAGYGSSTAQKESVDRDGAVLVADAAERVGVRRYVLVSSMGVDYQSKGHDADSFQTYLRLKGQADADVRGRNLDWTIVRPSGLDDGPGTGRVRVGERLGGGSIPREDVAALLYRVIVEDLAVRKQFEVTSGADRIDDLVW
ncbi:NAD(P)-binding oxidoreductase [Streptomyces sp. NPDC050997]|uniref:NAD(P)-binding oxidoreductase n=1 Tax=Streptomyces sp. NPDC050997 TaxID=3155519 RepID=UPI003443E002